MKCVKSLVLLAAIAAGFFTCTADVPPYAEALPAGYTQLEYIKSSGAQRIDTGIIPDTATGVDIWFVPHSTAAKAIFGTTWAGYAYMLDIQSGWMFHGGATKFRTTVDVDKKTRAVVTPAATGANGTIELYVEGQKVVEPTTVSLQNNNTSTTLNLFAVANNGYAASYSLYRFTMTTNHGVLARHLVPCRREADVSADVTEAIGLYDLVTGTFLENKTTTAFTAGPEVSALPPLTIANNTDTCFGTLSPDVGGYSPPAGVSFTATAADGGSDSVRSRCTGYEFGAVDPFGMMSDKVDSAEKTCTFTSAGGQLRLVWQWVNDILLSVGDFSGGSLRVDGVERQFGDQVWVAADGFALAAVPAPGKVFDHWEGVDADWRTSPNVWLSADMPFEVTPVFADDPRATATYADFTHTAKLRVTYPTTKGCTDFPALVKLSSETIEGFTYDIFQTSDGADMAFYDLDGNVLAHEIDTWNPQGESLVWVKLPALETNFVVKACFGSATVRLQPDARQVWTGYAAVWHFSAAGASDSTGRGLALLPGSTTFATGGTMLGGYWELGNGKTTPFALGSPFGLLDDPAKFTFSCWMMNTAYSVGFNTTHVSTQADRTETAGFSVYAGSNGPGIYVGGTGLDNCADRNYFAYNSSHWTLLTATVSGKTGGCYYGADNKTTTSGKTGTVGDSVVSDYPLTIGGTAVATTSGLSAYLTEVRVANGASVTSRITAETDTVVRNADFFEYGELAEEGTVALTLGVFSGGTVTANGQPVASGASVQFPVDTPVSLVATPANADGGFAGWTGDVDATTCGRMTTRVRLDAAKTVTPNFLAHALARGGDYSTAAAGAEEVHAFRETGTFVVSHPVVADILLVGGGGGGGGAYGSGGGAGGFVEKRGVLLEAGTYTVGVGAGGLGGATADPGENGGDSFIRLVDAEVDVFRALGGGGGGSDNGAGRSGGSGGGIGKASGTDYYQYGFSLEGQGNSGGATGCIEVGKNNGTGGGGAGAAGGTCGRDNAGGVGGVGRISTLYDDTERWYAGGGGGGNGRSRDPGAGGQGGGGQGGGVSGKLQATDGEPGTGGGGGGGGADGAGNGGSGFVVIRFAPQNVPDGKPAVYVGETVRIGTSSFVFKGVLSGSPEPTATVKVVYGTSPDALTSEQAVGDVSAGEEFEVQLLGLQHCSTYYYALEATAGGETTRSDVRSFVTEGYARDFAVTGADSVVTQGLYAIYTFHHGDTPATITPSSPASIDILLVGGGGGGGGGPAGGGGGAGGFVYEEKVRLQACPYLVSVGAGGTKSSSNTKPSTIGEDSFLARVTDSDPEDVLRAVGGGAGGTYGGAGKAGGSGGGYSYNSGGLAIPSTCVAGQGNPGTLTRTATTSCGGGGGGAGGAGTAITATYAGGGGAGKVCDITGEPVVYAAGGGGAGNFGTALSGGLGGSGLGGNGGAGGTGYSTIGKATDPVPHTGSGGGGGNAGYYTGGSDGATGVVIVRVRLSDPDDATPSVKIGEPSVGANFAAFRGELYDAGANGLYASADVYLSVGGAAYACVQQGWTVGEPLEANATGLAPETAYAYSLLVSNAVCGVEAAKGFLTTTAATGGAKPEIAISSVVTNNDLTAEVGYTVSWAGTGANLVDVKAFVGDSAEGPFAETTVRENTIGPGRFLLTGLVPGAHVFVKLQASNGLGAVSEETETVDILVTGSLPDAILGWDFIGATTATVAWRVKSIGSPAGSGAATLEYGTDPTFAEKRTLALADGIVEPNTEGEASLTGLAADQVQYLRVRVETDLGAVGYSQVLSFRTKSAPCAFSAIASAPTASGAAVSSVPTWIEPGASVSVTLKVNGAAVRNFSPTVGEPMAAEVAFAGAATVAYAWTATQEGCEFTGEYALVATTGESGARTLAPAFAEDLEPAVEAYCFRIGDRLALPRGDELVYILESNSVCRIDGDVLTAARAGVSVITLSTVTHPDPAAHVFATNVLSRASVIVLPAEEDAPGGVWIVRSSANFSWTDGAAWTCVSGGGSYPNGAGAWAYVVEGNFGRGATRTITLPSGGVTLGGLVTICESMGGDLHGASTFKFEGGPLTFATAAERTCQFLLSGNPHLSEGCACGTVKFTDSVPVTFSSDTVIDYLHGQAVALGFNADVTIPEGVVVELRNATTPAVINYNVEKNLSFGADLKGAGTLRICADAQTSFEGVTADRNEISFTGTLDIGGGSISPQANSPRGGFFLNGARLPNVAELIVRGAYNGVYTKYAGAHFRTGTSYKNATFWGTEYVDALPEAFTISGGTAQFGLPALNATRAEYAIADLTVKGPSGVLALQNPAAGVATTVVARVHAETSMLRVTYFNSNGSALRIGETPSAAREESDEEEFLPFLYTPNGGINGNSSWKGGNLFFRDKATGVVRRDARETAVWGADQHCGLWASGGGTVSRVTRDGMSIRSLRFGTANGRCSVLFQQPGDVLKVTGGLVQLQNAAHFATPADGNSAESVLDLGDKTGYLTTFKGFEVPMGCRIGANRLVLAGDGVLQYAGDSSATLSNGVHVTSGTLELGYWDGETLYPANLGKNDITVEAGAKLAIVSEQPFRQRVDLKLGAADELGAYGKVELRANATVKRCSVNGEYLTRGTWGATGSGADNVNDDLFSGSGVLSVTKDGNFEGFLIRIQ